MKKFTSKIRSPFSKEKKKKDEEDEEDENTYLDLYYILDNPECKKVVSEYATSRNCGAKLLFLDEVEAFEIAPLLAGDLARQAYRLG